MAKKSKNYDINNDGLEELLNDVLKDCQDDISEAEENISFYKDEILNAKNAKDVYGHLMNEALKIKGSARDRVLKAVNIIKDRVKIKEFSNSLRGGSGEGLPSPEEMLKAIDEFEGKEEN